MSGLFDVINLIHTKDHYPDEDEMKEYTSFMGNRALSQFQELIFHAQAMNENWSVPKEANFAFYYHSVTKKKRFSKWAKKDDAEEEKIKKLKEYYGYSTIKAREIIPIMDQLDLWGQIDKDLHKGGAQRQTKSKKRVSSKSLNR
jgi:hypothetical protein